ncbi:MAG TPA: nuclear transport factor 2 family protein [Croceibacterium sp.]|nr:nuclear transport factor 2 family protein [Croceibacterium sp.]
MRGNLMIPAAAALLLAGCNQSAGNDELRAELTALQDRIAIEDMLYEYYSHLGSGAHTGFDKFFTDDALLDINGWKATGHDDIQKLYDGAGSSEGGEGFKKEEAVPVEKEHMDYMHLTNPLIRVNGDTATAQMFWTGIISDDLNAPPKFEEMGREYDLLVKVDGQWKIKKRIVVADAGMPKSMNETYRRLHNYDVTKDD